MPLILKTENNKKLLFMHELLFICFVRLFMKLDHYNRHRIKKKKRVKNAKRGRGLRIQTLTCSHVEITVLLLKRSRPLRGIFVISSRDFPLPIYLFFFFWDICELRNKTLEVSIYRATECKLYCLVVTFNYMRIR